MSSLPARMQGRSSGVSQGAFMGLPRLVALMEITIFPVSAAMGRRGRNDGRRSFTPRPALPLPS